MALRLPKDKISIAAATREHEREYWQAYLSGHTFRQAFVSDNIFTDTNERGSYAQVNTSLDADLNKQLLRVQQQSDVSLYVLFAASLNILMNSHTQENENLFYSPILKPSTTGNFFNTLLPLRTRLDPKQNIASYIKGVQAGLRDASSHQNYPVELLIEQMVEEYNIDAQAVYDVALVSDRVHLPEHISHLSFNISFMIRTTPDKISLEVEYKQPDYSKDTASRLANQLLYIASQILNARHPSIESIQVLPASEKERVFKDFNATTKKYNKETPVHVSFEAAVAKHPQHIAVTCGGVSLTYAELNTRSNRLAHFLRELGAEPEQKIVIFTHRSVDMLVCILGIHKAGAAYIPVDIKTPTARLNEIINESASHTILTTDKTYKTLKKNFFEMCSQSCLRNIVIVDDNETCSSKNEELNAAVCASRDEIVRSFEDNYRQVWDYIAKESSEAINDYGWVDSVNKKPFSLAEMQEYVENVYQKVIPYLDKTKKVLELGCGNGAVMYRTATDVGYYLGTDLSEVAIKKNQERILRDNINNIELEALAAIDIDRVQSKDFDMILASSVVQYFPGKPYLEEVIQKAIGLLNGNGIIFLSDILDEHMQNQKMAQISTDSKGAADIWAQKKLSEELHLSHDYFKGLKQRFAEIVEVECTDKIGTIRNELTNYRYDVLIKVDASRSQKRFPVASSADNEIVESSEFCRIFNQTNINSFSDQNPQSVSKPDHLCYLIYTSGSTGKPKGVMIEHQNLSNFVFAIKEAVPFCKNKSMLSLTSISFDIFVLETFVPLVSGMSIVLATEDEQLDPQDTLNLVEDNNVTHLQLTPSRLKLMMSSEHGRRALAQPSILMVGGEMFPAHLFKALNEISYGDIYNLYGPTETTVWSSFAKLNHEQEITIGKPLANNQVYILGNNDCIQGIGMTGELCIGGESVTRGYWANEELTEERFFNHPGLDNGRLYRTGDLAAWKPCGRLQIMGRIDDQIKLNGHRIETAEIEYHLNQLNEVKDSAIIVRTNASGDSFLCAYVVVQPGFSSDTAKEKLFQKIPAYMVPSVFIAIDKLPLTTSGKVDKKALQSITKDETNIKQIVKPTDSVETGIVELWTEILGMKSDKISTSDNFFELGGNSISATILTLKLKKKFNREIKVSDVFNSPTVAALATCLKNSSINDAHTIQRISDAEIVPASHAQKRFFAMQQVDPSNNCFNLPEMVLIEGQVDIMRIQQIFNELADRHEILRTAFKVTDHDIIQVVHDKAKINCHVIEENLKNIDRVFANAVTSFDLTKAPLINLTLVKCEAETHALIINAHHIIADGTTMKILLREFLTLYRGEKLDDMNLRYRDYTAWQYEMIASGNLNDQKDYWETELEGVTGPLALPYDHEEMGTDGDIYDVQFNEIETKKIRNFVTNNEITLNMCMTAVTHMFLAHVSACDDIITGTAVSGRTLPEIQSIVGLFVNTLPLRSKPNKEKQVKEYFKEISYKTLCAIDNQDYPFDLMIANAEQKNKVYLGSFLNIFCLFIARSELTFDGITGGDNGGFRIKTIDYNQNAMPFDLTFVSMEEEKTLCMRIGYNTSRFEVSTIQGFANDIKTIVNAITEDKEIEIGEIVLTSKKLVTSMETPEVSFNL